MILVWIIFIIILVIPIFLAFFFPNFRHLSVRAKILEVTHFYIAPLVYFVCNEFHRLLGVQKGVGNAFFDLPLSYLTGLAIVFSGLKWSDPQKTRSWRAAATLATALAWFFFTPYYGK